MKKSSIVLVLMTILLIPYNSSAQRKKRKANKDTKEWRYELEAVGVGTQGTYQVKVWSYSKRVKTAIEQAKKNAVHGIVFKGVAGSGRVPGQRAIARNPNIEQEKHRFFDKFFQDGGKYLKYVTMANGGAIGPGDKIKIRREYKVGVVISVNVSALRKDLEDAGIIKGLSSGF